MSETSSLFIPSAAAQASQEYYALREAAMQESREWLESVFSPHRVDALRNARILEEGREGTTEMAMIDALNEAYVRAFQEQDEVLTMRLLYLAFGVSKVVTLEPAERARVDACWGYITDTQVLLANAPSTALDDLDNFVKWLKPNISLEAIKELEDHYQVANGIPNRFRHASHLGTVSIAGSDGAPS